MPETSAPPRDPALAAKVAALQPSPYRDALNQMIDSAEGIAGNLETLVALHAMDARAVPAPLIKLARSMRQALEDFAREAR